MIYSSGTNFKIEITNNIIKNNIGNSGVFLFSNGGESICEKNKFIENISLKAVFF